MIKGQKSITGKLIKAIKDSRRCLDTDVDLISLMEMASRNKILLHLLGTLNIQGPLRDSHERAMRKIVETVESLSKRVKDYEYAFFKFVKFINYVPADVDLLINTDQARAVAKEVIEVGYKPVVKDPYCITLAKGNSIIDLYMQPTVGGIIFIDGQRLLNHTRIAKFNGVEVRVLEPYAEALTAASRYL